MTTVWKRLELTLILAYAGFFYCLVVKKSIDLSADYSTGRNNGRLWGLKQEKIWTRFNDVSDSQWRSFRDNLPVLSSVMAIFILTGNAARQLLLLRGKGMSRLFLVLSFAYILHLHGACSLFLLGIAAGNFVIVKLLAGTPLLPVILWVYNLTILVCNRVYEGYSFLSLGEAFGFLDNHRGVLRWHINFNFVMLRMVSFGLDYHWACNSQISKVNWEKHNESCSICRSGVPCYLTRQEQALPLIHYSPEMYMCYLFYPPLYIAGPIISFNAFASQLDSPQKSQTKCDISLYGLRWIVCLVLMEMLTHYCYYNSLAISEVWRMLSPWEIFVVGYGVLNFMWLKFLLIWRYFRFWALVGGIEVVENMPRCINNCYDLEGFWKSWHASYNRWLVRYLYIPLGGARWRIVNIWVIFTFVAIWHDLEWKLLSWAWVTCLLMAPELLCKSLMQSTMMQGLRTSNLYRELCAIGGAVNITGLMTANLIGFVVGPQRMRWLIEKMLEPENLSTSTGIFCSFYVAAKLMFHILEFKEQKETMKQAD